MALDNSYLFPFITRVHNSIILWDPTDCPWVSEDDNSIIVLVNSGPAQVEGLGARVPQTHFLKKK